MLIASLFFAIMNVLVKSIDRIPVAQIVFMRSLVMFVFVVYFMKRAGIKTLGQKKLLLIFRGLFGTLGIALFFYTVHNMPLASAVSIHYLTPIFTALIAYLFFKEKLNPWQWFFFIICFSGVAVIKGFDPRIDGLSLFLGIAGTIGAASAYNIISHLKETEHHLIIMFYFPAVTLPLVTLYILIFDAWLWGNYREWIILTSIGALTYFAQYFLTKAYQTGEVNKVSIISYLGMAYALIFGFVLFDEWFSWKTLVGFLLLISGVLLNLNFKRLKNWRL